MVFYILSFEEKKAQKWDDSSRVVFKSIQSSFNYWSRKETLKSQLDRAHLANIARDGYIVMPRLWIFTKYFAATIIERDYDQDYIDEL